MGIKETTSKNQILEHEQHMYYITAVFNQKNEALRLLKKVLFENYNQRELNPTTIDEINDFFNKFKPLDNLL